MLCQLEQQSCGNWLFNGVNVYNIIYKKVHLIYFAYFAYSTNCLHVLHFYYQHILHLVQIDRNKGLSPGLHCLLPLLLGPLSQGPAVHVPPSTTIATVRWFLAECTRKVSRFSLHGKGYCPGRADWNEGKGYCPGRADWNQGRRPNMEDTGMTYKTCACSLHS